MQESDEQQEEDDQGPDDEPDDEESEEPDQEEQDDLQQALDVGEDQQDGEHDDQVEVQDDVPPYAVEKLQALHESVGPDEEPESGLTDVLSSGFAQMPGLADMAGINDIPSIMDMGLPDMPSLADMPGMEDMPSMKDMGLPDIPSLPDMPSMSDMPSIKDLGLSEGLAWPEGFVWPEGLDMTPEQLCAGVLSAPGAAASWAERHPLLVPMLVLLVFEICRYAWHRLRLVALNFRRHTPPSIGYSMTKSFEEHAACVERVFCDRADHKFCLEGLFLGRQKLGDISREMLEEALLAHLAMEVRRWYSGKHHEAAQRIIDVLEAKMGIVFVFEGKRLRRRTLSGGSIAQPIPFDAHPEAARKPFMFIGEQKMCAYFKPLPVQCCIWLAKGLKSALLWRWGFRWKDLGPVQMWVRNPRLEGGGATVLMEPPVLFCPGLFLGNTAYLNWIHRGLLPLGERRPLLLLELPHLSHGIDPRHIAYSLRYSWPTTDEICDALANELAKWHGPADIIGNSFGTVVMTALRVDHRHLLGRFVYIDPVCFPPCYPGPNLAAFVPYLDNYPALLKESWRCGPVRTWPLRLLKFLVLRPCIFGDIEVQYVLKRGLYVQEASEMGSLGPESLIVIGKQDELLNNPEGIADWVARRWPEAKVHLVDFNHGVLMGRPQPYADLVWSFLKESTE